MAAPAPLRLTKGKILRTKNPHLARLIFERMPEGCARLEGRDVVVMSPVVMTFEPAPEAITPKPILHPFIFDQPKR